MSVQLTNMEARLSEETKHEIERRFPDETFDRNKKDPHPFVMHHYVVRKRSILDVPGVTEGWKE